MHCYKRTNTNVIRHKLTKLVHQLYFFHWRYLPSVSLCAKNLELIVNESDTTWEKNENDVDITRMNVEELVCSAGKIINNDVD